MLTNTHGQTVGVGVWIDNKIALRPRVYAVAGSGIGNQTIEKPQPEFKRRRISVDYMSENLFILRSSMSEIAFSR